MQLREIGKEAPQLYPDRNALPPPVAASWDETQLVQRSFRLEEFYHSSAYRIKARRPNQRR